MITGRFALPISAGSAPEPPPSTEGHKVTYYDPFGEVIKIQYVLDGMDATPPTPPTFDLLTFAEWNSLSTNITRDENIGAIYDTTDGKTYVFARFNILIGFQPTMFLQKDTTDLLTVNWGDGTTTTSTSTGNVSLIKPTPYASEGSYVITIECAGVYRLGGSAPIFGAGASTYSRSIYKIYMGSNINILTTTASFYQQYGLKNITLNSGLTGGIPSLFCLQLYTLDAIVFPSGINGVISGNAFQSSYALSKVIFSREMTGSFSGTYHFQDCNGLGNIILPEALIGVIPSVFMTNNRKLNSLVIPEGITSIGIQGFQFMYAMEEYIFQSIIPPTLVNINAFQSIPLFTKIYVPDASVTDYKTATNWVTYADYIYPISTRPI